MESPAFTSNSANAWGSSTTQTGAIDVLAWVPMSSFNQDAFKGGSMLVTVRSDDLRGLETLGDEYMTASKEVAARVEELGQEQAAARHDDLVSEAQTKLDDAEAKLNDARTQIADGEKQIADGEAQIADGERQIAEGEATLAAKQSEYYEAKASGRAQLDEQAAKLAEAQTAYDQARASLDARQAEYAQAMKQLDEEEAKLDPTASDYTEALAIIQAKREELLKQKPALEAAEAELAAKKSELDSARAAYNAAEAAYADKIASAESQLASGRAALDSAYGTLEEGRATLASKRQELADAKAQLADKETEFADAKDSVAKLKDNAYSWSVLTRAQNGGVISIQNYVDIATRLRTSMASLFVLVGLFVCYSAVSRLVREQVRQIGAKKALGMRAGEITASFICYSGAAVVFGAVIGVLAAVFVVERIIVPVLTSSFFMPAPVWWSWSYALLFCAIELVLVLASTWLACHSVLSNDAVALMAGGEPPSSEERFFERWEVWQRLSLTAQTTINNLFNDKRRVVATLVGVAGCTALIVCAMTLNNDVVAGVQRQYSDVYHYDVIVRVNADEPDAMEQAQDAVQDFGCAGMTPVATRKVSFDQPDSSVGVATVTVPLDEQSFEEMVTLTSVSGDTAGTQVAPDESGVWISNAYAEHYGVKPGDALTVRTGDGTEYELPIAGFYRYYLVGHQIVMSPDLYHQVFGQEARASSLLVDKGDVVYDDLEDALAGKSFISTVADDRSDQETLFNSFRKISRVVVLVYLALSVLMAIVVLLNLNVLFVEEKRRDLITMMVCGYPVREAKAYIWHDNLVQTVLGIVLGVIVGMIAGWLAVMSMEVSAVSLVKSPNLNACIIGAVVSAVLSTIMTLVSLRRVSKLELSDINRT